MAALLIPGTQPDTTPDTVIYDVPQDGEITLQIDGRSIPVLAGPGMPSDLHLSRSTAAALIGPDAERFEDDDTGFSIISFKRATGANVGPVRIKGRIGRVRIGPGDRQKPVTARWFETDSYRFAGALAGPYALPAPVVRFKLRSEEGTELVEALPLAERGRWWLASTVKRIDGKDVVFAFAPQFRRTVASAAAGAAIVQSQGGGFTGKAEPVLISHGVERPARPVDLASPLVLGPVRIASLMVRTADYGSAASIADASETDASELPDDVVVRGRRRPSRPAYVVYVGADALQGCLSITYDKVARRIELACAPALVS